MFRIKLTGLSDSHITKTIEIGKKYRFYNGYMSKFDGTICIVEGKTSSPHKFKVKFPNGLNLLAYDSELEILNEKI